MSREVESFSDNLSVTVHAASLKRRYSPPMLQVAGSVTEMIQGCGGASGQDRNYYRIFCQGE